MTVFHSRIVISISHTVILESHIVIFQSHVVISQSHTLITESRKVILSSYHFCYVWLAIYELPAPESINARHFISLTSTTMTGNRPSPIWFVVKATPLVTVVELLASLVGCTVSQIEV